MPQRIFEFAAIYTPVQTKQQQEVGERPRSTLIVPVTQVLADDDKQAAMLAARAVPKEYEDKLAQVEIAVRPF